LLKLRTTLNDRKMVMKREKEGEKERKREKIREGR
jgi:hypothetical protein